MKLSKITQSLPKIEYFLTVSNLPNVNFVIFSLFKFSYYSSLVPLCFKSAGLRSYKLAKVKLDGLVFRENVELKLTITYIFHNISLNVYLY